MSSLLSGQTIWQTGGLDLLAPIHHGASESLRRPRSHHEKVVQYPTLPPLSNCLREAWYTRSGFDTRFRRSLHRSRFPVGRFLSGCKFRFLRNANTKLVQRFYAPLLRPHPRNLRSWLHHRSMGSRHSALRAYHIRLGPRCRCMYLNLRRPAVCTRKSNPFLTLQTRAAKGFGALTLIFFFVFIPVERLATREANLVRGSYATQNISNNMLMKDVLAPSGAGFRCLCKGATEEARVILIPSPSC